MAFLAKPHPPNPKMPQTLSSWKRSLLEGPQALGKEGGVGVAWLTPSPQVAAQ